VLTCSYCVIWTSRWRAWTYGPHSSPYSGGRDWTGAKGLEFYFKGKDHIKLPLNIIKIFPTVNWQGCRGYGDSHGDSHGYGYGMGMGTDESPWACGNSVGIFDWVEIKRKCVKYATRVVVDVWISRNKVQFWICISGIFLNFFLHYHYRIQIV